MSFEDIKTRLEDLISNARPDVVIIRGLWGVGKTYFWKNLVEKLVALKRLGLPEYAYVSLFGVGDIETVKNLLAASFLENKLRDGKREPGLIARTLAQAGFQSGVQQAWKSVPYAGWAPIGLAGLFAFLAVKNAVICIDDLERKGESLTIREVLGLAALLKEQRNCKVVFILNQGALSTEHAAEFTGHNEKLVDWEFEFAPSPEVVVDYVFSTEEEHYELIRTCCLNLGIRNVRILSRIQSFVADLKPYLKDLRDPIAEDVIRSTILFVWARFEKESDPPTYDFLIEYSGVRYSVRRSIGGTATPNEQEDRWSQILESYKYGRTDEVDQIILRFIHEGYFEGEELRQMLDERNREHVKAESIQDYDRAWDVLRDSFDNNEDEFLDNLISGFRNTIQYLGIGDLDSAVQMLRHFGRDNTAHELIEEYFEVRVTTESLVMIRENTIGEIRFEDAEINDRFHAVLGLYERTFDFEESVKAVASNEYDYENTRFLATQTPDTFYDYFKSGKDPDPVRTLSLLRRHESLQAILHEVLLRIGSESEINKLRVRRYFKIDLDNDSGMGKT
ncbi:MAG TPA: hypothetical protein PLL77_02410 [Pyrinomonadaceae bacterium]|nr:hypothetical protein [Pyrinomonadaceae bacterium]